MPDLAWRLLRQLRDTAHLAGGDTGGRASGLQLGHGGDPGTRKGMQIGIDRVDMHALGLRDPQRVKPHAVQQQGLRATLLVGISPAGQPLLQLLDFGGLRTADIQWTSHGLASWSEAGHSNND